MIHLKTLNIVLNGNCIVIPADENTTKQIMGSFIALNRSIMFSLREIIVLLHTVKISSWKFSSGSNTLRRTWTNYRDGKDAGTINDFWFGKGNYLKGKRMLIFWYLKVLMFEMHNRLDLSGESYRNQIFEPACRQILSRSLLGHMGGLVG